MSNLYERIETLCDERGINITQMCREAGIPRSALSDYKSNRIKSIATDKLSKIANYFGVSVDYLLTGEEPEQKEKPLVNGDEELTKYLEELRTRPEMKMLFQLTSTATKEDVEKAVKIIETMLGK